MSEIIKQSMSNIWASSGDIVAPDSVKIADGWLVEVVPRQYWNWMQNRTDTNLAYLFQHGIPEWDATVEYVANKSYVTYAGAVYKAILTGTNQNPTTATTYWEVAFATSTAALEALKGTTPAADKLPYFNSATTAATTTITPLARTLLDDTTKGEMLTTVGAQPVDATLTTLAALETGVNKLPYFSGVDTATVTDLTAFGRSLLDDADATAARSTLVLNNVNNTSDANKPVSTAQQAALDLKAPLASPALTGVPTAPTAAAGTSSTQLATTAFVNAEIANDAPTKTGGGASGSWGISVTGSAATATKLQTARTINGVPFDGTANIAIATGETGRLPLFGGTMTGVITHSDVAAVQTVTDSWKKSGVAIWNMGREANGDFKLWYYTDAGAFSNEFGFMRDGGFYAPGHLVTSGYVSAATMTLSGRATIGDALNSGWYRSSGAVGWYNETYNGGIYMTDSSYVRTYNSKAFLCNDVMRVEGSSPQVQLWDSDHGIVRYLYANGGIIGFLNSSGNWTLQNDDAGNTTNVGNLTVNGVIYGNGAGITNLPAATNGATAWVNFNGSGTVYIRDSYNVSSITDNGTGIYTINFSSAMANTNYALGTFARHDSTNYGKIVASANSNATKTAWGVQIHTGTSNSSTSTTDSPEVGVFIFGGK